MRLRVPVILVLLIAAASAFPQEAAPGRTIPRRLLLSVEQVLGSTFTAGDALMVARSLLERLQEANTELVVVESPGATMKQSLEELGSLAKKAGADSWLQITLDGEWGSAKLGIRSFDLLSNTMVAELTAERTGWGSPSGLAQESWEDVVEAVSGKFHVVENAAPGVVSAPQFMLTVKALPGSIVTGLGNAPLRIGTDGSASRMLPAMREYTVRTSRAGYAPITQGVFLSANREVTVEQKEEPPWGLEVSLLDGRAPGVDLTMAVPALSFFVRFGITTYAIGLALSGTDVFLSKPLTSVMLQTGLYLGPEDRSFRAYLGLGAFMRIVHAKDTAPVLDPLSPVGLRFTVGSELPGPPRGRLFFEFTPTLYQTSVPTAFRAALGQDTAPGWMFGPSTALSIISFRIGYRWQL